MQDVYPLPPLSPRLKEENLLGLKAENVSDRVSYKMLIACFLKSTMLIFDAAQSNVILTLEKLATVIDGSFDIMNLKTNILFVEQ